jgi:DNA modification methylase
MEKVISYNISYLDDLKYMVLKEPAVEYNCSEISNKQAEQLSVFKSLEKNIPFCDANSFCNQVHFQQANKIPVQRWFPYREGYSTKLVNAFLNDLKITGNVFDPFMGSGTTLLSSRNKNLQSFGIDINPISVLVAKVENEKYSKKDVNIILKEIEDIKLQTKTVTSYSSNFELADKVFNNDILQSLLQFKDLINQIKNFKIKNLFFMAWLSIIEEVSNVKKEGNGIKYKNRKRTKNGYLNIEKNEWESKHFPKDKFLFVKNKILEKLNIFVLDIQNNYGNDENLPKIFHGNCLNFENSFSEEIQFTFFSPPYCNCFDYFEIHKVELWLGDFIKNKEDFKTFRNSGFRSNTNSIYGKSIEYNNSYLEKLIALFNNEKLWNNKIPEVVRGYFDDSCTLLKKLFRQTKKDGYVGIVVGNSAYSGVIIPSDIMLANIAREIGFSVKNIFITRHLTTSSQQKKELEPLKSFLRESIILLKK